ncbi:hypothetical protein [Candidatus Magnetaquicoccus inordinatus]|uniref:hypothetical protein n=1 Tax=Candidatus Magnetaquicoccus inordinatus TaxID=2496818 RepID=UPI00102B6361|nr:hypothetical protein [Candidatus Magnetaquicoccus inordinatus]
MPAGQSMGWHCPDMAAAKEGDFFYSTIVATWKEQDNRERQSNLQEVCSYAGRLQGLATSKNKIPYNPFIVERNGSNGKIWSVHVGCSTEQKRHKEVLADVLARAKKEGKCHGRQDKQCPYPIRTLVEAVKREQSKRQMNEDNSIPPGRGVPNTVGNKESFQAPLRLYLRKGSSCFGKPEDCVPQFCQALLNEENESIANDACKEFRADKGYFRIIKEQLQVADINWLEAEDVTSDVLQTKKSEYIKEITTRSKDDLSLSIVKLHKIAAAITGEYRRQNLLCSEAVVIRTLRGEIPAIRICQFAESEKRCRCPVLEVGNDSY